MEEPKLFTRSKQYQSPTNPIRKNSYHNETPDFLLPTTEGYFELQDIQIHFHELQRLYPKDTIIKLKVYLNEKDLIDIE